MALSKSKMGICLTTVVLFGCSWKEGPADGRREAAPACTAAAYWAVDRIEEDIAVLENTATLRTEERLVKDLPAGVSEGRVLADDGALSVDEEETAVRAARMLERFERLKTD